MIPERLAEIELYTKHLTASGQLVGGCLRECLEEIARLRADASTASPSCDRCQSAHCCSVTGSTVPPLCVTDPDGSLPLWMPWTNADVQARVDPLHAEIGRLRAEAGRVVVPELTPDGMSTAAFVEGYRFAASRAHSVPSSRVLKDGEVGVDAETMLEVVNSVKFMASFECQCDLSVGHICEGCCASRLGRKLDSLRTQATATESGEKGGV